MAKQISIIIASYNEEKHIGICIDSLLSQSYTGDYDIIIADGGSNDKTISIVNEYIESNSNILLINNPKKNQAAGRNLAIRQSDFELVAYIDAHSYADNDWLKNLYNSYKQLVNENEKICGVGSVYETTNKTMFTKASETALTSIISGAGSGHFLRQNTLSKVSNAYACLYNRQKLIDVGLYNEELKSGEDIELNERLINHGLELYVDPTAITYYERPETSWKLYKQQFRYGYWRIHSMINSGVLSVKVFIPAIFVMINLFLLIITMLFPIASVAQVFVLGVYLFIVGLLSIIISINRKCSPIHLLWISVIIHISYGIGSIFGLLSFIFGKSR